MARIKCEGCAYNKSSAQLLLLFTTFFFLGPATTFHLFTNFVTFFFFSSMSDRYRHSLQLKPHSNRHLKSLTCSNYSLYIGFLSFDSFNDRELMVIIYRPSSGISLIFLSQKRDFLQRPIICRVWWGVSSIFLRNLIFFKKSKIIFMILSLH